MSRGTPAREATSPTEGAPAAVLLGDRDDKTEMRSCHLFAGGSHLPPRLIDGRDNIPELLNRQSDAPFQLAELFPHRRFNRTELFGFTINERDELGHAIRLQAERCEA